MRGRGLEIFFAAADLEEIEQLGVEVLGGGAGGEGSVVEAAAEARRHHGARELVIEREAQEGGRAEADDARPVVGKMFLREFEVRERGFELRAGEPVFDALDHAAKVEDARGALAFGEQAAEAAAQECGAGEVGRAFAGPQEKDGGAIGKGIEIGWARGARFPHEFIVAVATDCRQAAGAKATIKP